MRVHSPALWLAGISLIAACRVDLNSQQTPVRQPPVHSVPIPVTVDNTATLDFGSVVQNQIAFLPYIAYLGANEHLTITIQTGINYKTAYECDHNLTRQASCLIIFGFEPTTVSSTPVQDTATAKYGDTTLTIVLKGIGIATAPATSTSSTASCISPDETFLPTILPTLVPPGVNFPRGAEQLAGQVSKDFGRHRWGETKEAVINCFYQTTGQLAFFTQVKAIYNAVSGSNTITANIGSYNFNNGMQVSLGTNIQAGSTGTSPTTASSTIIPTLTTAAAAQAAQNLFFGGNIFVYDDLPLMAKKASGSIRWHFEDDVLGREGVDIQNFSSGTSASATSPTSHFNAFDEAYWQYDADPATGSQTIPLSIFIGGQYGYAYTSHAYTREYGFVNKANSQIGDASVGVLVTGQFNISVLREFGPSQKYKNSATDITAPVNNFKSWSFGIQYQTKGLTSSGSAQ